jgi:hypothetical protein
MIPPWRRRGPLGFGVLVLPTNCASWPPTEAALLRMQRSLFGLKIGNDF